MKTKLEKKVYNDLVAFTEAEIENIKIMERYMQRKRLSGMKIDNLLADVQRKLKEKEDFLKFLYEIKDEYT